MKRRILKMTILIMLPLTILWIVLIKYNLNVENESTKNNMIYQTEIQDSNTGFLIASYIEKVSENLMIVRDSNELNSYIISPNENTSSEVAAMFKRVMNNKFDYDQIRFIDADGKEIIRVDNDSELKEVSENSLQDKSDRYYYLKTKELAVDEIYISPIDLNEENGAVEIPYKPMVRFATPIYNAFDEFKGILIINYKAEYFAELLEEQEAYNNLDNLVFFIVNRHGEFILQQDAEKNLSFMFNERESVNISELDQEQWNTIQSSPSGVIEIEDKLITYYDILSRTKEKQKNYDEKWIAIHQIDISELNSPFTLIREVLLPKDILVIVLILLFAFIVAVIFESLKKRDDQLFVTKMIANSTNDGVMITDNNTNITYVNTAYELMTGYRAEEVMGMKSNDFKSGKQDKAFYTRMWKTINEDGSWEGMLWDKKKDGVLIPLKLRIVAVKRKNEIIHYISIMSAVDLNKYNSENIQEVDYKEQDFLIPNEDLMLKLLKQSIEDSSFRFMVLYISIENFNQLVTTFKHFEDKSSELFMELIKPLIRQDDFIAQTGRNVFAVIIGIKNLEVSPEEYVKKIHKKLSEIISVDGKNMFFKTRIGVSFWPKDTDDLKRLLLNSIVALEWTYNRQTSEVAFFSEKMLFALNQENEIEGYLRKAIKNNELYMVYQPQVDLTTNKVVGLEALIRWDSAELGLVSPAAFIPVAERTHLIIDIGYWIIDRVCSDLKEIEAEFPDLLLGIRSAINISSVQMQEGEFLEHLYDIVEENKIDYNKLEIEITESLLLNNEAKNIEILNELRAVGFTIAIDDFGTGYSSLSYLNILPIDKIKIDRSFIKDYPDNDDGKLAKILVDMAESLGIDVLIEGAETSQQISFLNTIGCRYLQGYYYSKPLNKKTLVSFLLENQE